MAPAGGPPSRVSPDARTIIAGVLAGAIGGSLLLMVAEFTTLFHVHVVGNTAPIRSVTTGSHNSYSLVPIAVLACLLALGAFLEGSWAALLALTALSIVTLLIALLGDLPDAHARGIVGSSSSHFLLANATPGAGLYLETLGAVTLLIASGSGLLLLAPALGSLPLGKRFS